MSSSVMPPAPRVQRVRGQARQPGLFRRIATRSGVEIDTYVEQRQAVALHEIDPGAIGGLPVLDRQTGGCNSRKTGMPGHSKAGRRRISLVQHGILLPWG